MHIFASANIIYNLYLYYEDLLLVEQQSAKPHHRSAGLDNKEAKKFVCQVMGPKVKGW